MNKKKSKVFDIVLVAMSSALLFAQEQVLTFLPNIQLTIFLIIVFSKKLGLIRTLAIVTIHTLLDNLFMGSFSIFYTPFMFIGWMLIPITINTLFKKVESNISLAFLSVLYSFIYCWLFIIPQILLLKVDLIAYFVSDIVFEIILAMSSFLSTLLLYNPLSRVFDSLLIKDIY